MRPPGQAAGAPILLVDDDDAIRQVVVSLLQEEGYCVEEARSGAEALEILARGPPALALVDLIMPVMTGWELFEAMRATPELAGTPIVVMSAAAERAPAGAARVLRKPIAWLELLDIVHEHCGSTGAPRLELEVRGLRRRNAELVELERARADSFARIVPDLRNPLTVLMNNVEYLRAAEATGGVPDAMDVLAEMAEATAAVSRHGEDLALLLRLESGHAIVRREPTKLLPLAVAACARVARRVEERRVELDHRVESDLEILADPDLLARVLDTLLEHALRSVNERGRIAVEAAKGGDVISIAVSNDGPPIAAPERARAFDKDGRVSTGAGKTSLGLYFCRLVVEAHGGRIELERRATLGDVGVGTLASRDVVRLDIPR